MNGSQRLGADSQIFFRYKLNDSSGVLIPLIMGVVGDDPQVIDRTPFGSARPADLPSR